MPSRPLSVCSSVALIMRRVPCGATASRQSPAAPAPCWPLQSLLCQVCVLPCWPPSLCTVFSELICVSFSQLNGWPTVCPFICACSTWCCSEHSHKNLCGSVSAPWGHILARRAIARSRDNSRCRFLMSCQTLFHNGHTVLCS